MPILGERWLHLVINYEELLSLGISLQMANCRY